MSAEVWVLWSDRWAVGWTSFVPFTLGGVPHYLAYKVATGEVAIDRIRPGGRGVDTLWTGTWAPGWMSFVPFTLGGAPHYLAYKAATGEVAIDRIKPDGKGVDGVWTGSWAPGWTSFAPLTLGGAPHYLAYKVASGEAAIDRVRPGGVGVDTIWTGKWAPGWTAFMPFTLDGAAHYLAYQAAGGAVSIERVFPLDPALARWFETGGHPAMGLVRSGNQVIHLIDGGPTFAAMAAAIRTATKPGHFIYLLGWWLSDDVALIPGDVTSTIRALFASASNRGVQVRALLWDQVGTQNNAEVNRIDKLGRGAAILDNRTLNAGSHHQKILIVNGSEGLIALCGGVDINADRIAVKKKGDPQHDVHCRITGPAAHDLLRIFVERWQDHPDHVKRDKSKGALLGLKTPMPPLMGKQYVQIGRTYGNGSRHPGIGPGGYAFAPNGERTASRMSLKAIREARRFIYMEDQYLVSMEASNALRAALPRIEHLTILIPHGSISDLPQAHFRRRAFIAPLRAAGGTKVRVFFLSPAGNPHTYVHAKIYVVDDEFAIIGSANCNRRGWTHDSEVVAGIFDRPDDVGDLRFAHQLRIALWAEHLNMDTPAGRAALVDGVASAKFWLSPPPGARIAPYDENRDIETIHTDKMWNDLYDPDGS